MRNAVLEAAGILGGQTVLAKMLGISAGAVSQFVTGIRKIPEQRCPAIEVATGGAVKCEDLRDDLAWVRIADAQWPWHPAGRPLLDVAAVRLPAPIEQAA